MPVRQFVTKMSPKGWAMIGGSVAVAIVFVMLVMNFASKPSYSTLLTGLDPAQMTRAYAAVRDSFGLLGLNTAIDALDGKLAGEAQLALYRNVQDVVLSQLAWFMRNARLTAGSLTDTAATFKAGIAAVSATLDHSLGPSQDARRSVVQQRLGRFRRQMFGQLKEAHLGRRLHGKEPVLRHANRQ